MKPDASTPSGQGRGNEIKKTGNTVAEDQIPKDNRAFANADSDVTEGALPEGQTAPHTSRLNDRPSRGINRGLHS
ncbi:MAG: hypothetical protein NVV63_14850 [Opitutus sp.]|nr:hypothetical protein [Opitutus sp.]